MAELLKKANKTHSCDICGHNIDKGQIYKYETIYCKVNYDSEFDTSNGGYTKTWRTHEHKYACDLAINKFKTDYENINPNSYENCGVAHYNQ